VMQSSGLSSFQALQNALSREDTGSLHYYAFDLPFLDGRDLRKAPLVERKSLLDKVLSGAPPAVRYSSHVPGSGTEFYGRACTLGLEGIVSKRADSPYRSGRGREWLKIKCGLRQEMVIGGYTDPGGARSGLGALLLGVYEPGGSLRYSGKVGTGFDHATLDSLRRKLDTLARATPPFSNPPRGAEARRAHWVSPRLVAEIAFTEWTEEGTLRHPSFQGLRADKDPKEVVRERPAGEEMSQEPRAASRKPRAARGKRRAASREEPVRGQKSGTSGVMRDGPRITDHGSRSSTIAGITLTHPDKVLYPEARITKRDLALYYEAVADRILPHLAGRPLMLVRCPNGWNRQCFHQKHATAGVPQAIERIAAPESGGKATCMMANSLPALIALAQMGVLELHPWGSSAPKLGHPDRIIFDIDPDDGLPWSKVADAARLVHSLLEEIGFTGFLKTTGGKGLHVVVPVRPVQPWDTVKGFTKAVAELLAGTFPDRFTATMSKAARRGKIYVDYLRNAEGATAIATWSARARANAPVSTPIDWDELDQDVRFDHFNAGNVPARLARLKKNPWQEFFGARQTLTAAMMKRVAFEPDS
jgi:bifunctional non-homologous end joining protein LigD